MNGLGEYICGVVGVCAVISLAGFVSYRGELDRAVKGALAVIMLAAIVLPLRGLSLEGLPDFSEDGFLPEGGAEYEKVGREAFEEGIRLAIAEKFHIDEENIAVTAVGYDFSSMRAERIRVLLSGGAVTADARQIRSYITEQGLGECEVEIEI